LGRQLMTCAEAMRSGDRVPTVESGTSVLTALKAITSARAGSVLVIDGERRLLGIFTDGDLRRALMRGGDAGAVLSAPVSTYATMPCRSVQADELVQTALRLCSERKINELPVIAEDGALIGLLDVQDLVNRGFEAAR
jgi:arabinose-5-phosphate isomerase